MKELNGKEEMMWADESCYKGHYQPRYIIGACTVYKGIKFIGKSHANSMRMASQYFKEPLRGEFGDGFIDNFGKFLSREEAMLLAKETDQFNYYSGVQGCPELYSEDLWK